MNADGKPKPQMTIRGRKGGAIFPRITLKDAVKYARKLVSKTHVNPQTRDVILSGVVGNKGSPGNARISALKQFGFLKGDNKSNYSADDLAKRIDSAPEEELQALYRISAIKPSVFKALFDTFQGDKVTKAKLKQRAADLKIHPEETENCVEIYVSSLSMAGLVKVDAEGVAHIASSQLASGTFATKPLDDSGQDEPEASDDLDGQADANDENEGEAESNGTNDPVVPPVSRAPKSGPRAVFNVNVTLDSSMDIEKLQKQLELLKRFGAI